MGTHTSHTMHRNSLAAYNADGRKLSDRALKIYAYMVETRTPMTDRTVQRAMGYAERGQVQPRISELVKAGLLVEVDKVRCVITGKPVRRVAVAAQQRRFDENGQGALAL